MTNLLISPSLRAKLQDALKKTDEVALYNVTHDRDGNSLLDSEGNPLKGHFPKGGPFGATLAISYGDTLELIGPIVGNSVVDSGIASQHAEDRALTPASCALLRQALSEKKAFKNDLVVWMISSGQSCPTCHSKQEILARALVNEGLLSEGRFGNLYGATFDDTFKIAQFYDAQYADALTLKAKDPQNPDNLVHTSTKNWSELPTQVKEILEHSTQPTSVILRNGEIYATGHDTRTPDDPFSTADVNAIREACLRYRREDNVFDSWSIDGILFSTSADIGPLVFTELAWTKITECVHVILPDHKKMNLQPQPETVALNNTDFLSIVAQGYKAPKRALSVFRDMHFNNTAQPMWARVLAANNQILYNGASVSDRVLQERSVTRFTFAAPDLAASHEENPSIQPLEELAQEKQR